MTGNGDSAIGHRKRAEAAPFAPAEGVACARCGQGNRPSARYCDACGSPLGPAGHASPPGLLRDVFVGREPELAMLDAWLAQARAGHGGVAMVAGEPGIGKTCIAEMVARVAAQRGFVVVWGRCREEPGAPPYWPWAQAIRAWLESAGDEGLPAAAGGDAFLLSELVGELGERLSAVPAIPQASSPEEARFRLFSAASTLWRRVAERHPLMLVLDDLHWADAPSLKLLEFFSHEVGTRPILVLGLYRHNEVTRRHPLSDALAELARQPGFGRVELKGLSLVEASQYVAVATGSPQPGELVEMLHARTEGNPLFLAEMTRFLQHEGLIGPQGGLVGRRGRARPVPDGIREVIGKRLNRLSAACNRLLGGAAVIGRRFGLELLAGALDDLTEDERLAALEEALAARIVSELPETGWYQFSHALIRETLYDEMPAPSRSRLHQRIGAALEARHRDDPRAGLSALAYHYCAALPGGDAAKAMEYARRAGEHAGALLAYEEAARHFQLALKALDSIMSPDPRQRCQLLIALGEAQTQAGADLQAISILREAAAIAKGLGDADALIRAAIGFEAASWQPGLPGDAAAQLLDDALAALGEEDGTTRARLLSAQARALGFTGEFERAERVGEAAVAMARRLGDDATLSLALNASLWAWKPWRTDVEKRAALAAEAYRIALRAGDKRRMLEAATTHLLYAVTVGDFEAWREVLDACEGVAEEMRQPFYRLWWKSARAAQALFEGHFDKSERLIRQTASELGRHQYLMDLSGVFGFQMFNIERERGGLKALAPLVGQFVRDTPKRSVWRPALAVVYAEMGMKDEARAEFEALAADDFACIARDSLWSACVVYLSEVCAFLGDAARAAPLYRMLLPFENHTIVAGACVGCYGAAARFLGMLAATMGRWAEAERHFERALAINTRMGAPLWAAHARHDYARMLAARGGSGDAQRALALLDETLSACGELGMRALAERAAAVKGAIESRAGPFAYPAGLSRREVDVLRLVAAGRGNREIAAALCRSENTVANHIRAILAKTGSLNRTAAAAFARSHGLLDES